MVPAFFGYGTIKLVPLFCGYGTIKSCRSFLASFFSAHKTPSPFFYTSPTKTLFQTDKWSIYCRWHMLRTAKSANVGFRLVVQLFAPLSKPATVTSRTKFIL